MLSGYNNMPPAYLTAEATLNCYVDDDKEPIIAIFDSTEINAPYRERCCCAGNRVQVRKLYLQHILGV
jgi:hypothetical protein